MLSHLARHALHGLLLNAFQHAALDVDAADFVSRVCGELCQVLGYFYAPGRGVELIELAAVVCAETDARTSICLVLHRLVCYGNDAFAGSQNNGVRTLATLILSNRQFRAVRVDEFDTV